MCFVTLLWLALFSRAPLWPQPPRELWIFVALAIGPMLLGHTGMNWALKYLPAYVVTVVILAEPVGATILGIVLPGIHQIPPLITIVGGIVVLCGVLITMRSARALTGSEADPP
jgi:drug/metabolite transporter (DMT)-like permease